jgi:hypothetical protein
MNLSKKNKEFIPFHTFKALRIAILHCYSKINLQSIWDVVLNRLPELEAFCQDKLKEIQTLEVENRDSATTTTTTNILKNNQTPVGEKEASTATTAITPSTLKPTPTRFKP